MTGPLDGVRVLELSGLGPLPFAGMILADLGAEVVRVDRVTPPGEALLDSNPVGRGRRSVALDLKTPAGLDTLLRLSSRADVLIEGFRPGVAERLGFGPDHCRATNPRLVYGRMTGWGQDGPLATAAGHDINYLAVSGALQGIGTRERPIPPGNLLGDMAGGGLLLALGVVSALFEARGSGRGQVIDASIVDGAALLTTAVHELVSSGEWVEERAANVLDGGAGHYNVYETADGRFVSVGALEPRFFARLCDLTGVDVGQDDPQAQRLFTEVFRRETQQHWCDLLEGTDACFAPVLSPTEATRYPANVARGVFVDVGGVVQPAPAPRFSRSTLDVPFPGRVDGADTVDVLTDWGFGPDELTTLLSSGAARQHDDHLPNPRTEAS